MYMKDQLRGRVDGANREVDGEVRGDDGRN